MASTMSSALRSSTRRLLHPSSAWRTVAARGIASSSRNCEAHNFNMPALSPTMTEGSIASWKINEGDTFSAGDVIIEVETDKAQMDVEAQDDGILAKIFVQAGKDPIKVGTRIGILADPEDDISTLKFPPEKSAPEAKEEPAAKAEESKPAPPKDSASKSSSEAPVEDHGSTKPRKNPFVASPGLTHLLHINGLEMSEVKGTGPGGRVLKGDVLAHLGKIDKEKPKSLASSIAKLAKLDLSNIKPKAPTPKKEEAKPAASAAAAPKKADPLELVEVSIPISLTSLKNVDPAVYSEATLIANAVQSAHTDLPASKIPPTISELFDDIIGLPVKPKQPIYAVDISEGPAPKRTSPVPASDIFDEIIGIAKPKPVVQTIQYQPNVRTFKVKVPAVDKSRAQEFLSRVKYLLEEEVPKL